jgi:hypothetical protein
MLNWLFMSPAYGGGTYSPPIIREPTERDPMIESRLHALEVACAGLWQLLKEKNGYTDEELMAVINSRNQQPQPDAQPSLNPATVDNVAVCPKCHHKMLTHNHNKCLWCGATLQEAPFQP